MGTDFMKNLEEWQGRMIVLKAKERRAAVQVKQKAIDPTKPTVADMNGSPIGSIPFTMHGGELCTPKYFDRLLAAAGLRYNGGWVITANGRTNQYEKFKMLQEAVRVCVAKNLFVKGIKTFVAMGDINRDDLMCACLGMSNVLRVKTNEGIIDANIGTMEEVLQFGSQRLSDWLSLESKEPEYQGKMKTVSGDELPDFESPTPVKERQMLTIHRGGHSYQVEF